MLLSVRVIDLARSLALLVLLFRGFSGAYSSWKNSSNARRMSSDSCVPCRTGIARPNSCAYAPDCIEARMLAYICLISCDCSNFVSCSDLNCVIGNYYLWASVAENYVFCDGVTRAVARHSGHSSIHFENRFCMLSNQEWPFFEGRALSNL